MRDTATGGELDRRGPVVCGVVVRVRELTGDADVTKDDRPPDRPHAIRVDEAYAPRQPGRSTVASIRSGSFAAVSRTTRAHQPVSCRDRTSFDGSKPGSPASFVVEFSRRAFMASTTSGAERAGLSGLPRAMGVEGVLQPGDVDSAGATRPPMDLRACALCPCHLPVNLGILVTVFGQRGRRGATCVNGQVARSPVPPRDRDLRAARDDLLPCRRADRPGSIKRYGRTTEHRRT